MALNFRKYTHPFGSNRINFAEVDQLYTKNEILKISMGDQLDYFYTQWLDSNFIPMDSKKFEFRNFDYIIRFAMKNESGIEKFRSRDQRIFEENRFYEIKTLTHNHVNRLSDKRNWTVLSDSTCNLVLLTEVS